MLRDEYTAGLFDGEGSVGIYKNGQGKYFLRTQLTQNHTPSSERIVKELVATYGGHYTVHKSLSKRPFFNWQLNTERAINFLEAIYPYLVLKKSQAALAIAWHKRRPKPTRTDKGHFARYSTKATKHDKKVSLLMKKLKKQNYKTIVTAEEELSGVLKILKKKG